MIVWCRTKNTIVAIKFHTAVFVLSGLLTIVGVIIKQKKIKITVFAMLFRSLAQRKRMIRDD